MKIFHHGIKLPDYKELSLSSPRFKKAPIPNEVTIYLKQHEGIPALPLVETGTHVLCGTKIAAAQGDFSANIHASISGVVSEITSEWIRLQSNGKEEWEPSIGEVKGWRDLSRQETLHAIFNAGIVGLGRRAFPTYLKLKTASDFPSDVLVLNGCESDAFLTSDYVLMLNHPTDVLYGAELLLKASGLKRCVIVIEDNKLDCVELLLSKIRGLHFKQIEVKKLPARYPQGEESELVRAIFGRKAREFKIPPLVFNVATAFATYEAVRFNKPLFERVVTITGHCVVEPQNLLVRVGTPAHELIKFCKGFLRDPSRVIFGGPMSGVSVTSLEAPIAKSVGGIVALADEYVEEGEEKPCIRCGFCVEACPEYLVPEMLIRGILKRNKWIAKDFHLTSCIECGNCTYVCPSKIPILDILRQGKTVYANE